MGVAVFGAALTGYLDAGLGKLMPGANLERLRGLGATAHAGAQAVVPPAVRDIIADAITHTFSWGLAVMALAIVAILFIPNIALADDVAAPDDPTKDMAF